MLFMLFPARLNIHLFCATEAVLEAAQNAPVHAGYAHETAMLLKVPPMLPPTK